MKQQVKKGYKAINIKSEFNAETNEVETSFDVQINPQKGDFVVVHDHIIIVSKNHGNTVSQQCVYYTDSKICSLHELFAPRIDKLQRYASPKEIAEVKQCLASIGKVFNEETKEIEDRTELIKIRKRAEKYKTYYYLNFNSTALIYFVDYNDDYHYDVSNERHLINNYFLTREAAQKTADELNAKIDLKEFFKNSKEE